MDIHLPNTSEKYLIKVPFIRLFFNDTITSGFKTTTSWTAIDFYGKRTTQFANFDPLKRVCNCEPPENSCKDSPYFNCVEYVCTTHSTKQVKFYDFYTAIYRDSFSMQERKLSYLYYYTPCDYPIFIRSFIEYCFLL